MKKLLILLAVIGLAAPVPALAQQAVTAKVVATCGNQSYPAGSSQAVTQDTTGASCSSGGGGGNASVGPNGSPGPADSTQIGSVDGSGNLQPASAANPIPITGTITTTVGGFANNGNTAALAVSTTSADVALPAGTVVAVTNNGATDVRFRVTIGAGTSVLTDQVLKAGITTAVTVGTNTHLSAITASSTSSLVLAGGTGLLTGYGVSPQVTNQSVNVAQVNGVTTLTGAGATGTGSQRNTVAQDTTTIAGSAPGTAGTPSTNVVSVQGVASGTALPASQSGTWNVGTVTTITNPVGVKGADGSTIASTSNAVPTAGAPLTSVQTSALAANQIVSASATNLWSFDVAADSTLSAAPWWIMIYNNTSAPADGAVTPTKCYALPAGATTFSGGFPAGVAFSTGVVIGVSTTGCFSKTASTHAFISGDVR